MSETDTSADPFATDADDPFGGSTPEPAPDSSPEIPADAPEAVPTVNREGEPVEAQPEEFDPVSQTMKPTEEQPPQEPDAAVAAPVEPQEATQEPEAAPEPQEAGGGGSEPPEQPPAPPAADDAPVATVEEPETPVVAAPPSGPGPRGGKGEMRYYKLLYQTGERGWTEFDLTAVPEGLKAHIKVVDGQPWLYARNNDHAKRVSFAILGSPKDGVTVFPVPKGAWKPSRIKPAPPAPERTRLVIE